MKKILFFLALVSFLSGCNDSRIRVTVNNILPFDRTAETVEIAASVLAEKLPGFSPAKLIVTDSNGNEVPSQVIYEGQTEPVSLIFQADAKANAGAVYYIKKGEPAKYETKAFGRFVPERMDDYAWENDRIAFRIYGTALIEKDGPSNGIDVWIKRTDKMVIDRWYADYLAGKNTYHDDNGEGCDCFKVGRTLGAGAMAPFVNDSLWLGINFSSHETLDNGPVRTSFRLTYPPFPVNGAMVSETRTFSLDAGSQLSRVTEEYSGLNKAFPVAAGIIERPEGAVIPVPGDTQAIAYRLDGGTNGITYVGTILPVPGATVTQKSDHLLITGKYTPGNPLTYYTGAGWSKWGFDTDQAWVDYLSSFSQKINTPLQVTIE
jgi:hypothetical protein